MMKKRIRYIILCLNLITAFCAFAQNEESPDSILRELFLKKDFNAYFEKINELGEKAYKAEDISALIDLSPYLKEDFGSLNTKERMSLRKSATYLGNKLWNLDGTGDLHLEMFLIAHENARDKLIPDSLAWYIENSIAVIYTEKDNFEKAEYFSGLVERSLKHYNLLERLSRFYTNKGRRLKSEGKIDNAIQLFTTGYVLADSIGYKKGSFVNALNLAELFNEYPDKGDAELYLTKADTLLPALRDEEDYIENLSSLEIEKGNLFVNKTKYTEGIRLYKKAIDSLAQYYKNPYRRELAKVYKNLAFAYLMIDSIEQADLAICSGLKSLIPELTDCDNLPDPKQLYPENTFVELFVEKSRLFERLYGLSGDKEFLKKAITTIHNALLANDLIRESIVSDNSKLLLIKTNKELVEKGVEFTFKLLELEADEEWIYEARRLFSRSKSILYDEKTLNAQLITLLSPEDKEEVKKLQKKLNDLHNSKYLPGADLVKINGEILACQEQILSILNRYKSLIPEPQKPGDYIEYLVTEGFIYGLSELGGTKKFIKLLPIDDFTPLLKRLDEYIRLKNFSTDEKVLNEIFGSLLRPFTEKLPGKVVIITDDVLGYVPFEILKNDQGESIIAKTTVAYQFAYETQPSLTAGSQKTYDIVCLAPEYPLKESGVKNQTRGSVYHLPYAKIEVAEIVSLFGRSAYTIPIPLEKSWDEALDDTKIFHYSGHAIVKGDEAYLALTAEDNEFDQLTAEEIRLMHHSLELVVLSACETATGALAQGEGVQSLGRSFMEAGAKATIISLWNVNDKSTSQIISSFYKKLTEGYDKDESLRMAKLEYLTNAPSNMKHPFFWAAFIPAGDMTGYTIRK